MPWYTARLHLELDIVGTLGRGRRAARDALILVRAETAAKAWGRAEELGRRYEGVQSSASLQRVTTHFVGVREVHECSRGAGDERPVELLGPGVELLSTDCEVE